MRCLRRGDGDHQLLGGILGVFLFLAAEAGAFGAVADVVGGGLEVALAHEFLLDHVLDVLDVDERRIATADALGDAAGDFDGGFGVFLDGEEGFSDGDFDLGLGPRDDVAIAADQADGQRVRAGVDIDAAGFSMDRRKARDLATS
jgi:hypothetical protein